MISTDLGVWISSIWFIIIFSFIIKDTPAFKLAETTAVGVAAGVAMSVAYDRLVNLGWNPIVKSGVVLNIIPLLLGPLIFAQISRKWRFYSRIPLGFMLATGIGVSLMRNVETGILTQVQMLLIVPKTPLDVFNRLILISGCICTLLVFTYTREHRGWLGWLTKYGQWIIMIGLGASVGVGIAMRSTYLADRLQQIVFDLLGLR